MTELKDAIDKEQLPDISSELNVVEPTMKGRAHPIGWGKRVRRSLTSAVHGALEHRRFFVLSPFLLIAGLIAYRLVPGNPQPVALITIGCLLAVLVVTAWRRINVLRTAVAALLFWCGFSLLALHGQLFGTEMLGRPIFGTYLVHIDKVLNSGDGQQRIIVSDIVALEDSDEVPMRRARLFLRNMAPVMPGDRLRGRIRFAPVPGPVVAGGFDSQFHGYFDGVGAFGNTLGTAEILAATNTNSPQRIIDGVRHAIGARIDLVLAPPLRGIARALTIGDQSQISDETRATMASAGLAHVLAISGLHLSLVAGGVFFLVRMGLAAFPLFTQRIAIKKLAAIIGTFAGWGYLLLSGGSVSAIRATIMLTLIFGAMLFGRRALTMRNVVLAALLVIATAPASIFRPSFQLSFAAVAALVGIYEMNRRRDAFQSGFPGFIVRILRFFGGMALTSLVAGAATALFAAYHFQQTAPLGVAGNLMALPLVGFVVLPAAAFAVLAMPLGMEAPFLKILGWGIERIISIAEIVSLASTNISASPLLTPFALIIGFAILAWFSFFQNRWRFALLLPGLIGLLLFGFDRAPDIIIADSTQAVAVRTNEGMMLIAGRTNTFATNAWEQTFGAEIVSRSTATLCDDLGCVATGEPGFRIALVKHRAAFAEDCTLVDVVITRLKAPSACRAHTLVIDADDLVVGGVHQLYWQDAADNFAVRPAITDIIRPWRPSR